MWNLILNIRTTFLDDDVITVTSSDNETQTICVLFSPSVITLFIICQLVNERLGSTSVAWVCLKCNGPNYSSILFDLHGLEGTNRFSTLSDTSSLSIDSVDLQALNQPKHASSPIHPRPQAAKCARPLRVINVNCQSLVNKKGPFYNLPDSSRPDVIIATGCMKEFRVLNISARITTPSTDEIEVRTPVEVVCSLLLTEIL